MIQARLMGRPDPQIRDAMLAHLRQNHPSICRHWFDDIEALEMSNGTLKLLVREAVQLRYLQKCCIQQFNEAVQAVTGHLMPVQFVGESEVLENGYTRPEATQKPRENQRESSFSPEDDMLLSPDYSFEDFVIGPGNRLAHAAALAVSKQPGKNYNPLFIHGGVGLGKSHLLQAICQAAMRQNPQLRIYYISCNSFMNQFVECVQAGRMLDFRTRFRNVDLLIVDDIHDLSTRDRTQEEFFHTFNTLYQSGRQIVLSSDAAPSEIPSLEERLVSRFSCGLVTHIERPCFETRVAIVKKKANLRGLALSEDVASYIAARIDTNIRELEGAITKIQNLAIVDQRAIDLDLAKEAIGEFDPDPTGPAPSIETILDAVTEFYDVRLTDLLSKRRHKSITRPRQIGMWLARRYTRYSLEEIGSYFGGRDHTTVMHAIRKIERRRQLDASMDREISCIENRLTVLELEGTPEPTSAVRA